MKFFRTPKASLPAPTEAAPAPAAPESTLTPTVPVCRCNGSGTIAAAKIAEPVQPCPAPQHGR